ncbi:hypothetical protein GCM10018790_56530 [Kitasatospora xanthocidica]|nr:hypothetical protein GCM10018790_56530 [Kitasatospora xanthocidica]
MPSRSRCPGAGQALLHPRRRRGVPPTRPVDVGGIADDALSLPRVQVIDLINTAYRESGMRAFH